jgi:hypothetical protein
MSIIVFSTEKYKKYAPSFKHIDLSMTKDIIGIGGQFFLIMMCMLLIFQFTNCNHIIIFFR